MAIHSGGGGSAASPSIARSCASEGASGGSGPDGSAELGLRTALNLSRELPAQDVLAWFEAQGVRVAHLGIAVWTHPSVAPISAECAFVCRVARSLRLSCRRPGRPARPE